MRSLSLAIILALGLTATAVAQEPAPSLSDIEDEVMCVECGVPLSQSTATGADREREYIREQIARGQSKQQIEDGLVARFGPSVLTLPPDHGFGLAAYLVPILTVLLALIAVALAARRWRRPAAGAESPRALAPEDARRIESELAEFDRQG
jgi:cytochrome c-type biogenesis protein CcmH